MRNRKLDKLLRSHLKKSPITYPYGRADCPSIEELNSYICATLEVSKKETLEKHLSRCPFCLDNLMLAIEGEGLFRKGKLRQTSRSLKWMARNIERIDKNIFKPDLFERNKILPQKRNIIKNRLYTKLKRNRWLIASTIAFLLSFAFPKVFLQFLLVAAIFGAKWIFESQNAKTLIMIYNAWRKGRKKEFDDLFESIKDRITE